MPMTGGIVLRAATQDDLAAMAEISVEARSRYRTMSSFAYVAETPAIAECRYLESCAIVAVTPAQTVLGFALSRPLDGLLLLDNISTSSRCRGQGFGKRLLDAVLKQATTEHYPAVVLTTFREPPWNGPWFRKFGFEPMLDHLIGPALRALIEHQSTYLDPRSRETLWRRFRQT
jgi:N-acetylglutamate synthase-like GNAT family acetyltransferase